MCELTSSAGARCGGERYWIVWLIYHCMYDVLSRKWPLLLKWTPWISLLCRSFHIAIQFWWYCSQYRSILPLISCLCTTSKFTGSTGMGWRNPNCRMTLSACWNSTVAKQMRGTTARLTEDASWTMRGATSGLLYGVQRNYKKILHKLV